VVGTAAELIDPHDPASIDAALERVLRDPARRDELSAAGLERAALFDWRVEAMKLREIIHRG
jgi:glycosyltransferase involved in cell wall biosynthesis